MNDVDYKNYVDRILDSIKEKRLKHRKYLDNLYIESGFDLTLESKLLFWTKSGAPLRENRTIQERVNLAEREFLIDNFPGDFDEFGIIS